MAIDKEDSWKAAVLVYLSAKEFSLASRVWLLVWGLILRIFLGMPGDYRFLSCPCHQHLRASKCLCLLADPITELSF